MTEPIDGFEKDGYLVFEKLIRGPRLDHYLALFEELVNRGKRLLKEERHWSLELDENNKPIPGRLHKVQGVCVVEPRVLELAAEPAILAVVESLIGPAIDVFGTKFFPKLAGGGTSTHWHQDNFYFGTESDRIVSCAIYLEDTDVQNGCLRIVPRSHRQSIALHKPDPSTHGHWTTVDESKAMDLLVPAGTVVLFSANLLHGAWDNRSPRTRYSTAWHYLPSPLNFGKFQHGQYEDRFTLRKA